MRIITIDKYVFSIDDNVAGIEKNLSVNYDKKNTITRPVYTHLGGYDEEFSFEATILLDDVLKFSGFEELVKQAIPLKISAFDLVRGNYILIYSMTQSTDNFVKLFFNGIWYYTKKIRISGYLL
ncbi:hypothetical protein [Campylobacter concisus]|jgi:hypothetical protein|uniref:Phage tail protein n=1 Tax=Campylobacter concisus TaxID=199 RepID=A0A7S9REA4_9BACT|nr:hypothetical protein [Campylobacter concisus]QPH90208.1 hypothetical protein CVT00_01290 [Campylobacter concisus]DAR26813.1 MAG TPA: hypothetical protein [Caudoviricetes sp.]DAR75275.1 MAG TPA: hypothetical protein [Caudoviricetes sp.]DAW81298.1 MAG TPA: hypothetical protein [Bacteriophage sp.]